MKINEYAVIKTGGKQYLVKPGDKLKIEKIEGEAEKVVAFDQVLAVKAKEKLSLGKPILTGTKVKAKILDQARGVKIRIAKFKAKSRYRKVMGHRQPLTEVEILPFVSK